MTEAFSKSRRVRRPGEFKQVFDGGTRLQSRHFTLLLLRNGRSASRLGIVASRRLGGAVQRNRAKRLIREMFRRNVLCQSGPGLDAVIIPRREALQASPASLTQDFTSLWRRAAARAAVPAHG